MTDTIEDVFLPPLAAFIAEKIAELLRRDVDPSLTALELRQRGFSFWAEKMPNGHFEFTVFYRGEEISFHRFLLEIRAEQMKQRFITDCLAESQQVSEAAR